VGLLVAPVAREETQACGAWLATHVEAGSQIVLPEIVDYEVRRVYLHRQMPRYLRRLDDLIRGVFYQPLTTPIMHRAAELWAEARRAGRKTSSDAALDVDMILCAQAQALTHPGVRVVVATRNVRHLSPFVEAAEWHEIQA
jgi:predicted nucleic acid-binding protein